MKLIGMFPLIFFGLALHLQAGEDVEFWIKKMQANMEKAYHAQLDGNIQIAQAGMALDLTMKGELTYRDATHTRFKMNMAMNNPDMPMTMDLIVVQDGEHVWTETRISAMREPMVVKTKIGKGGSGDLMPFANPLMQVEAWDGLDQLKVVEKGNGKVVLAGVLDEKALKDFNLGQGVQSTEMGEVMYRIEMEEKTAFPSLMSVSNGDKKIFEVQLGNVRFIEPSELPDDLFTYQPPEGVVVQEQ